MQRQIRLDKFEQILPKAMRARHRHVDRGGQGEPPRPALGDLGRGYVTGIGYYVFTDRGGDRIERAALGPSGYLLSESGAYDIFRPALDAGGVRQGARPETHRRQHVRRDRPGRRPLLHDAPRTCRRRSASPTPRASSAPSGSSPTSARAGSRRDRRLRRSGRHRHSARRARAVERGHHAGQDHARGRGVVDAGPAARARPRLRVRHAVGLRHRPRGHRRDLDRTASSSPAT
jgi:hypothetical protein